MAEKFYIQAINEAVAEEMHKDEKVFVVGESVCSGGGFKIYDNIHKTFGADRILDAPIAETGIAGAGIGAALCGYRPVVDLMYSDFMFIAADEIFLKAAQWRFQHGGKVNVPVTFIANCGGGLKLGNEHSKTPTGPLLHFPGVKCVMPSTPYDAKGLLKTSIRDNNPVFFMWPKLLGFTTGEVPDEEYTIPFGVADVKKEGTDVTLVATGVMVPYAMFVAKELEGKISVEVIDPRTLEPLDLDTILKSVEKTGRLVIAEEDNARCGFAGELGFQVMEKAFDLLDAPIKRVCSPNYPIPGGFMEQIYRPNPFTISAAVKEVMGK